jgi:hypothetical protein
VQLLGDEWLLGVCLRYCDSPFADCLTTFDPTLAGSGDDVLRENRTYKNNIQMQQTNATYKHRYPTSKYADRFHNNVMPSDPVALPARASPITTSINDTILITALVFSLHKVRQNPRLRGREVKAADVQKRLCHLASAEERPLAIILLHLGESMIRVDVALMPPCIGKRWLRLSRPRMSNPARDDVSSHSFKAVGGVPPSGHDNHRTHHIARHSRVE